MENLLTVAFEAHHKERNHHRYYEVAIGRDLLDAWTVAIRYGRIGRGCQKRCFASQRPDEMRKVVREHLQRRLSARKRIDCAYRLSSLNSIPGFDAGPWLPGDLMAKFFG